MSNSILQETWAHSNADKNVVVPHSLPTLERPTGRNHVDIPGMMYTAGDPGEGCHDILSNRVYWTEMQP